jgi:hypothetical protein
LQIPEQDKAVAEAREMKRRAVKSEEEETKEQEVACDSKQKKMDSFWTELQKSDDLNDNIQQFVDHLKEFTSVESVYVGKLVAPKKDIQEDDDDQAHNDEESSKIIQFSHANKGQDFMVDQTLTLDENKGITHDVFKESSQVDGEEAAPEGEEGEEGEQVEKAPVNEEDQLLAMKHVYVPEVVREPKMVFYKVPRLGSYMAVPLVYESCLFESALDNAVADFNDCKARREEQQKLKDEWEETNKRDEGAEGAEPAAEGEEVKEWEVIEEKEFETYEEKFVVCVDTMGQDKQISKNDKLFILRAVKKYKEIWEQVERDNLTKDRDAKLGQLDGDKDFQENEASKANDEEEKYVEEQIQAREDIADDDTKELETKKTRLAYMSQQLAENEKWRKMITEDLCRQNVLK